MQYSGTIKYMLYIAQRYQKGIERETESDREREIERQSKREREIEQEREKRDINYVFAKIGNKAI